MPLLCEILGITINDLFSGEVVDMKDTEKKLEENLLEMTKQKEKKDRQLLTIEVVLGVIVVLMFLTIVIVSATLEMSNMARCILILVDTITFVVACFFIIRIEQKAGYYECQKCHHKYIPTYSSVLFAMHINRTRYMRCPKCNKKSWQKKVISKE